ncbi:MAG: glycoside hydrolase family 95-like protein, partial [Planctomycetota bacterium]
MAIHPLGIIRWENGAEDQAIIKASLADLDEKGTSWWTGYSFQSGKGHSNFRYRPFTLEGNFAAAAGLQEMLLQSYSGTIRVFPAIPASWEDVSFRTLRAEGAFLITAERTKGLIERVDITAEKGGICRIEDPFGEADCTIEGAPG